MSFSREYAHRPPIPTAEEILDDYDLTKNKDILDPVFILPENEFNMQKYEDNSEDKDLSAVAKNENKKQKEIMETYNKVAEFLQQNKNLRQSVTSMDELSKELHEKKDNLTQLISSIKKNMQKEQKM